MGMTLPAGLVQHGFCHVPQLVLVLQFLPGHVEIGFGLVPVAGLLCRLVRVVSAVSAAVLQAAGVVVVVVAGVMVTLPQPGQTAVLGTTVLVMAASWFWMQASVALVVAL